MNQGQETEGGIEHSWSIWTTLPLHPQPQWLESLSSYLTRLAEGNGFQSIHEVMALAGSTCLEPTWRTAPDYVLPTLERIAHLARCRESALLDMTFIHLAYHFGHPTHPSVLRRFFEGSLSSTLRYCPRCLADHAIPYYRLPWRFLTVVGCHKHGCLLLSNCGHCHGPIPLCPLFPRLVQCPACHGDLRKCQTSPIPQKDERWLTRAREIELLLMPAKWAPEITSALVTGYGWDFLRQRKQLTLNDAVSLLERERQTIEAIEQGRWFGNATFCDYLRYIDLLDSSLSELVEATQFWRRIEPWRALCC